MTQPVRRPVSVPVPAPVHPVPPGADRAGPGAVPVPRGGPVWVGPPPNWAPLRRPVAPDGTPLAEFWERLLAYLLDGAIVGVVITVPAVVLGGLLFWPYLNAMTRAAQTGQNPPDLGPFIPRYLLFVLGLLLLQILVRFCYEGIYQARGGQTVGKRTLRIKVVRLDGAPVTLRTMTARWAVQFLLAPAVPLLSQLDGLWQLWDQPYRQCLHDKAASTTVVKVEA